MKKKEDSSVNPGLGSLLLYKPSGIDSGSVLKDQTSKPALVAGFFMVLNRNQRDERRSPKVQICYQQIDGPTASREELKIEPVQF